VHNTQRRAKLIAEPIPMKRELKPQLTSPARLKTIYIAEPIPMKRELKLGSTPSWAGTRSLIAEPIPMKRELKLLPEVP